MDDRIGDQPRRCGDGELDEPDGADPHHLADQQVHGPDRREQHLGRARGLLLRDAGRNRAAVEAEHDVHEERGRDRGDHAHGPSRRRRLEHLGPDRDGAERRQNPHERDARLRETLAQVSLVQVRLQDRSNRGRERLLDRDRGC